jgi:hypothetical protein
MFAYRSVTMADSFTKIKLDVDVPYNIRTIEVKKHINQLKSSAQATVLTEVNTQY